MNKEIETILNDINIPIIIINTKTKEYEWVNKKASEISNNLIIDFSQLTNLNNSYSNNSQIIINNSLYKPKLIELDETKQILILDPILQDFIDYETDLLTFKGLFLKYETLYSLLYRRKKELVITLLEIDKFQNILTLYSYQEAIKITKKIAEIIKSKVRENVDLTARYTTNTFIIVLSEVDQTKATKVLERIQKSILEFSKKENPYIITASMVGQIIKPSSQSSNLIFKELEKSIEKLIQNLEYYKKIKQNFIIIK